MDPSQEGPDSTLQDSGDQKEIIWEGGSWVEFELSRTKPGKSQEVKMKTDILRRTEQAARR